VTARAAILLLGLLGLAGPARATHEPDHRFIVIGLVTDGGGRGLPDIPVVVTRLETGLAYRTRTERDGLYLAVIHLHDEDEGDRLTVSANGVTAEIVARFAMRDRRSERGTRLDVRGRAAVEDRRAFAETLRDYLAR